MVVINWERISTYSNNISSAETMKQDNYSKIVNCCYALSDIQKAQEGISFMSDTQIPYTKESSEKAFHFEEDYYSKLKLRYNDYNTLFNSICNAIDSKIEELNNENKNLSSKINNLETQISLLKRGD